MSAAKEKKSQIRKWIVIIICSLFMAGIIRCFFAGSFRMPSEQMESTLLSGDYIWVDKTAYGIKTPRLWSEMPVYSAHDKIVKRNDVVLYRLPSGTMISRCLGLPGDTLEVKDFDYYINGKKLLQNPNIILPYQYPSSNDKLIIASMMNAGIPFRDSTDENGKKIRSFSRYELYRLTNFLPDSVSLTRYTNKQIEYRIRIPEGQYWMLSDNVNASADSRHFGFIDQKDLIGKAIFIWLSKDPSQNLISGYRWNRFFHKISR